MRESVKMSDFDEEPLSLESLFAFVNGDSVRDAEEEERDEAPVEQLEETAAEEPTEAPDEEPAETPDEEQVEMPTEALVEVAPVDEPVERSLDEPAPEAVEALEREPEAASSDGGSDLQVLEMIVRAPAAFVSPPAPSAPPDVEVAGTPSTPRGKHSSGKQSFERAFLGKHASGDEGEPLPVARKGKERVDLAPLLLDALTGDDQDSGAVRALIDERLEDLIQQRLDEVRTIAGVESSPHETGEQVEDDSPERGEQPAPASPEEKQVESSEPLSSVIFDEPPTSLQEGLREADVLHRRGFAFKTGLIAVSSVLVVGLFAFALFQLPHSDEEGQEAGENPPAVETDVEGADAPAPEAEAAKPTEEKDQSGSVTYRYLTATAAGEERHTTETVTFGRDGFCETSTLEVQLADAEAVEGFLSELERDFGSSCKESEAQGANARAVIDVSANKLDREGYEDALRVSVEDLTIVKKS